MTLVQMVRRATSGFRFILVSPLHTLTHPLPSTLPLTHLPDFLPLFVWVLVQCGFHRAEIEAEYMWGLAHPSLFNGEAGYYLTTLTSAGELRWHDQIAASENMFQSYGLGLKPTVHSLKNVFVHSERSEGADPAPGPATTSGSGKLQDSCMYVLACALRSV